MSSNEVGSITRQQLKRQNEPQTTSQQSSDASDIEVFASNDVSAKVNLNANEENMSLFENTTLHLVGERGVGDTAPTTDKKRIDNLPQDIIEKYPSEKDQAALKTLTEAQLEQAKKLMGTKIPAQNIVQIVQLFKADQVDTIKREAEDMELSAGGKDNVFMMALSNDNYDISSYNLKALSFDMTLHTNILNKDLSKRSIEKLSEHTTTDGKTYREREAFDLGTNTISKTRYDIDQEKKEMNVSYEIRSKIDENGEMISGEYIKPSAVKGMYDISVLTEDGTKNVSKVTKKKNGKTTVRRDMESPDGTRTEYLYRDTPDGNRYMRYKITDKDGNVLMNNKKSFKVIDDNTFKSSFNDESYTMTVKDNILTVQNDNDENDTAQIDLSKIEGQKEALIPVLKQMPGDQLIALSKTTDKLVGIDNVIESYYYAKDHSITSGNDMFAVLHEGGHAKDFQTLNLLDVIQTERTLISRDKELSEVFEKEKAEFNKAFPGAQREHVDYFINTLSHYSGPAGGLQETVAESNAILETPRSHEALGLRTQYLQQYFPKTIAKLNTLLSEDRERAEQKIVMEVPEFKMPDIQLPKELPPPPPITN